MDCLLPASLHSIRGGHSTDAGFRRLTPGDPVRRACRPLLCVRSTEDPGPGRPVPSVEVCGDLCREAAPPRCVRTCPWRKGHSGSGTPTSAPHFFEFRERPSPGLARGSSFRQGSRPVITSARLPVRQLSRSAKSGPPREPPKPPTPSPKASWVRWLLPLATLALLLVVLMRVPSPQEGASFCHRDTRAHKHEAHTTSTIMKGCGHGAAAGRDPR